MGSVCVAATFVNRRAYSVIGPLICVVVSGGGRGGWQGN